MISKTNFRSACQLVPGTLYKVALRSDLASDMDVSVTADTAEDSPASAGSLLSVLMAGVLVILVGSVIASVIG